MPNQIEKSDTPEIDAWCELAVSADISAVLELAKSYEVRFHEAERSLNEAKADSARLDWCERNLLSLVDGGGAFIIEYGSVSDPKKLGDNENIGCVRMAIDAAMNDISKIEIAPPFPSMIEFLKKASDATKCLPPAD